MSREKYCAFEVDVDVGAKIFRSVKFRPVSRPPLPWRLELIETARHIRASTDRPIYVCMSGGIDSEVVARSFLEAGIQFEALTLRHVQNTNEHDVAYALDWCRRNGVRINVVPFDVTDFFVNGIWRYVEAGYDAGSKTYLSYTTLHLIDLAESMGGSAVICNGESRFISDPQGPVRMDFRMWWYNNVRYLDSMTTAHFPWFFKTTPEMVASYLDEDLIRLMTRDPSYFACPALLQTDIVEKSLVYHRYFQDMKRRPKHTGWETARDVIAGLGEWMDRFHSRPPHMLEAVRYMPVAEVRSQLGISDVW